MEYAEGRGFISPTEEVIEDFRNGRMIIDLAFTTDVDLSTVRMLIDVARAQPIERTILGGGERPHVSLARVCVPPFEFCQGRGGSS